MKVSRWYRVLRNGRWSRWYYDRKSPQSLFFWETWAEDAFCTGIPEVIFTNKPMGGPFPVQWRLRPRKGNVHATGNPLGAA